MSKREFKLRAEAAFLRANPTAKITGWISAKIVTYPTGVKEYSGKFYAVANGFKPSIMYASGAKDYVMVR